MIFDPIEWYERRLRPSHVTFETTWYDQDGRGWWCYDFYPYVHPTDSTRLGYTFVFPHPGCRPWDKERHDLRLDWRPMMIVATDRYQRWILALRHPASSLSDVWPYSWRIKVSPPAERDLWPMCVTLDEDDLATAGWYRFVQIQSETVWENIESHQSLSFRCRCCKERRYLLYTLTEDECQEIGEYLLAHLPDRTRDLDVPPRVLQQPCPYSLEAEYFEEEISGKQITYYRYVFGFSIDECAVVPDVPFFIDEQRLYTIGGRPLAIAARRGASIVLAAQDTRGFLWRWYVGRDVVAIDDDDIIKLGYRKGTRIAATYDTHALSVEHSDTPARHTDAVDVPSMPVRRFASDRKA